jgi:hypothetical protein
MNHVDNFTEEKSRVIVPEFPTDVLIPKVASKIESNNSNDDATVYAIISR